MNSMINSQSIEGTSGRINTMRGASLVEIHVTPITLTP
jgi:hypothetical protein